MAGKWGPAKNGCSVGAFYSGFETRNGGTEARITSAKVRFKNTVNISDSTNSWEWGGTAVSSGSRGSVSLSGTGERDVQTGITATWVALGYPGSPVTRTFTAKGEDINYAGGDLTVSVSIEYPDRPWQAPAAVTSVSVTRVSDTQQNLAWTNNATGTAPYGNIRIKRRLGTGSYATIATVASSATSYADKSTVANAKYDYLVEAFNSTAATPSSAVGISTTPAAPTNGTVSKSGTTITCGWDDNSGYETGFRVERQEDGGAYNLLTTTAANATSAQHTGANAAKTHRYRIAAQAAGSLQSAWLYTDTVALQAPPNAPLVSVPAAIDAATTALVISYTHKPTDATVQTAAEVRWRAVGAPTWTTVSKTTQTSHSIAAGTLTNGATYEVQVRTKGSHATYGAWSASVLVACSTTPQVTIAPGGVVTTSRYTLTWTYVQAESEPQQAWQAELWRDSVRIEQRSGTGATGSVLLNTVLVDDATYTVKVWAQSATGLGSAWATDTFTVEFLPPPTPVITATFDPDTGATEVLVTVPAAEEPTEARRNLAPVPQATGAWAVSYATGGAGTNTTPSDARFRGGTARQMQVTTAPTSGTPFIQAPASPAMAPMQVGETWVLAYRYALSGGGTLSGVYAGGANAPVVTYGPMQSIDHGDGTFTAWRTATCTSLGSGDGTARPYISLATAPIGTVLRAGDLLAEKAGTFGGYLDGGYSPDGDLTPGWVGTANASASTLTTLGTVEPVSVDIYRDGHPLAIGLPIPDEGPVAVVDRIPPLATDVVYRALVWSINSSASADDQVDTRGCCWLFLNGGPDWSVSAKLKGSPAISSSRGRVKVLHHFEDDEWPTEFLSSKARSHTLDVSGKVATFPTGRRAGMGSWADWEAIADLPAPVCYRDPLGRREFVSIGDDVSVSHDASTDLTSISVGLTKVGGDDDG